MTAVNGEGTPSVAAALAGLAANMIPNRSEEAGQMGPAPGANLFPELEGKDVTEQLEILAARLEKENRIKDGAEKMIQVLGNAEGKEHLRKEIEVRLSAAKADISALSKKLEELREQPNASRPRKKPTGLANGKRALYGDDFKTALNQANAIIQRLQAYNARQTGQTHPSPLNLSAGGLSPTPISPVGSMMSTLSAPPMNDADLDRARLVAMTQMVNILQRTLRVSYELDLSEAVRAIVPALADYASKDCRAAAYRLIRHIIIDVSAIGVLEQNGLEWYMVRSLCRDNKHAIEKEQVIKLIRTFVDLGSSKRSPTAGAGSGSITITEPVMRALIAVAEHNEDQFRHAALETLAEILLIDIDLISRTGGMRVLLQALVDGPYELAPILATAFLYIADAPQTRSYLRPGSDLEIALTGFTDAYGKGSSHVERMRSSSQVISVMLRTWSGLMYLCMNDMLGITSIINTLRIPSLDTREVILDLFFDVLNIETPDWYKAYISGRRLTVIGHKGAPIPPPKDILSPIYSKPPEKLNLTHQYIGLLLLVFIEAGLLEALVGILEETNSRPELLRKATLLLGEILQIANNVLPLPIAARIQSLPRLFSLAADYGNHTESRRVATATLSSIDSYNRNRARLQKPLAQQTRQRANSVEDRRVPRQVEPVKVKLGMQIDERTFQNLLVETQVITHKDHTKWNFEVLTDLIEGPLMNPKRLEEAFKVSKFGRRFMSFFHPFSYRFSTLKNIPANHRYVRLATQLLITLISCPEGVRFLSTEDALLKQIADSFQQVDPLYFPTPVRDPLFSKQRMQETLSYGYLGMLGTLSKYPEGIELMERFKLFTCFYRVSELKGREDLVRGVLENLDYSGTGHGRVVLSKVLTSGPAHVRLYATHHLGQLIRASPKASEWTLRLLLTQLYDPDLEVCELAVQFLEEACESMDVLELVVQMQPTLDHLGEIGHPLLLKFMSTPVGFRYLYKADYINREMEGWFHERNYQYVIQVEVYLAKSFTWSPTDEDEDLLVFDGTVPPHFYGEMAKTEYGCQVLSDKGHFGEYAHFIRQHGLESEDMDIIVKLKSVLWAVGNIGATTGGLPFLEEEGILPNIVNIAENSLILSVRGTCFFVLGLISSTPQGAELLDEFEWESTLTPLGHTTGLCIPLDIATFVRIPPWTAPTHDPKPIPTVPPENHIERQIMSAISNLQNTVVANEAARTLTRLKTRYRRVFSSISLFYRALHTISTQRYRLPVRRYVLDLFDVDLDPEVMVAITALSQALHLPDAVYSSKKRTQSGSDMDGRGGLSVLGEELDMELESMNGSDEEMPRTSQQKVAVQPQMKVVGFALEDDGDD